MRIQTITLREIRLRSRSRSASRPASSPSAASCLLELTDADGTRAWSECVAGEQPNYSAETIDTAWLAIREWLAPRVLGTAHRRRRSDVHALLERNIGGHNMAKAAIEMGCWGLAARQRGVSALASCSAARAIASPPASRSAFRRIPRRSCSARRARVDAGYRKIKVKIQPGADVEFVRAVREALGADVDIMADANSAYTLDDADHLAQLDAFDLIMIEQPLRPRRPRAPRGAAAPDDDADLPRRIDHRASIAREDMIALGSGTHREHQAGTRRRIHRVEGDSRRLRSRTEFPSGAAACSRAASAARTTSRSRRCRTFSLPGDLSPSARYWERDIVTPEWTMDAEGMVAVPTGPGLGVTVDVDRVDDLTVRSETLGARRSVAG